MRRREFLSTSGGLLAGGLVGSGGLAEESTPSRPIRKAAKFHMVTDQSLSVRERFEVLKECGFEGTEIHTRFDLDQDEVKAASEATGVVIHGVLNSSNPDISAAVELAAHYAATSVLVVAGRVNKQRAYDANWDEWLARLKDAAPHAASHNVQLLVENVWNDFLLSPLEMARFVDEVDHDSVGVYFDVGNVVRFGYPDQWIRILGGRIGKLDIKDYSRKLQRDAGLWRGFEAQIGDGDADWASVRTALGEIDYRGWATAEVKGGDKQHLSDVAARMDRVLGLA